jgi:signal transduction histidine kinase
MNIERFFLVNLLRISLGGTSLVLVTDILYAHDLLSIIIDVVIVSACVVAFIVKRWSYNASVLIITCITLAAMVYQWMHGVNITTSMAVILLLGFIYSILLRKKLMWTMHGITCAAILVVVYTQAYYAADKVFPSLGELATVGITYFVLYFIISYCTAILKSRYDQINHALRSANEELLNKTYEIEAQNEELLQSHESVSELNKNLESMVMERTAKVHAQNEMLLKYTYTNAHHLRGPVARLLGLISIHKLEPNPDYDFFFSKMEDQAKEIDSVVKQINEELEDGNVKD